MALRTAFTELFSLRHPIALAPMGGASGRPGVYPLARHRRQLAGA